MLYYDMMEEQNQKSKMKKMLKYFGVTLSCILVTGGSFLITLYILKTNYDKAKNPTVTMKTEMSYNNSQNNVDVASGQQITNIETPEPSPEQQIPEAPVVVQNKVYGNLPKVDETTEDRLIDIYYSNEKQVYLTFDDGPSSNITPQILDILKANDVKATFFVLGSRLEVNPEITKRAYNEGHYIANHGYSHVYSSIYAEPQNVIDEYNQTEQIIKNAIGIPEYNSYLFRFPGGSSGGPYDDVKSEAKQMLDEQKIIYTNWNCLTGDAAGRTTVDGMMEELMETMGEQNSLIVLMHDAGDKQETVNALPEIIKYFKDNGYVFKNFYEIFK